MRTETRGALISAILNGSWRTLPPASIDFSERQLDEVTPLLYGSGAAALGWARIRNTSLRDTTSGDVLHQAYRLQVLQGAIHEESIKTVFNLLRAHSIEPLLAKGWAAASLYPERALRPYGDIDICVSPSDWHTANELLNSPAAAGCWVDLHRHFSEIEERSYPELFERSHLLPLDDIKVRVLSPEDHLALLSIHLLKHGAWRPLWLCDIAAAVESLPADFDWQTCLGKNLKRAGWIRAAISLAEQLLGAAVESVPLNDRVSHTPHWLLKAVLKQWEQPFAGNQPPMSHPLPMATLLRHPSGLVKGLKQRWPNPILATVSVNGSFGRMPPFAYQLGNCISRAGSFVLRLPGTSG
jgi:hypothetical protein